MSGTDGMGPIEWAAGVKARLSTPAAMTIADCDRRLLQLWQRYEQAALDDDTIEAEAAYALLDALLDVRIHMLAQR